MTSIRAATLGLALASIVGCTQSHGPACSGEPCRDAGTLRDAGELHDAGVDTGPPSGCGGLCEPCCAGDVCFGGLCDGRWCRGGIMCDAGVDAAAAEDAGARSDAGSACAQIDALDRHCATDADCAFAIHAADCCGTYAAIGFAASEQSEYAALEPQCDASYPACGCAAGPTMTDSGEIVNDPSSVQVACVTRGPGAVCLTYVTMRPPNGR